MRCHCRLVRADSVAHFVQQQRMSCRRVGHASDGGFGGEVAFGGAEHEVCGEGEQGEGEADEDCACDEDVVAYWGGGLRRGAWV